VHDDAGARILWDEAAAVITPSATLTAEQWTTLGEAHLDLKKASKIVKNPVFRVPRRPGDRLMDVPSGLDHHHLHILILEHMVETRG